MSIRLIHVVRSEQKLHGVSAVSFSAAHTSEEEEEEEDAGCSDPIQKVSDKHSIPA